MAVRLDLVALMIATASVAHALPAKVPKVLTPAQIAARALPSVVLIRAGGSVGTGFIVGPTGRIATNLHVIDGATEATIVMHGGREETKVSVIAVDDERDLAVLKISGKKMPALPLAAEGSVRPGDAVVAIGHPLGLGNTISDGLISAIRQVGPELTILQTSAPISPGSSGGPLINSQGEVVGVSTLVSARGQNLNFGMPIRYVRDLLNQKKRATPLAVFTKARKKNALTRNVPSHAATFLDDCKPADITKIESAIASAIEVGAPLYNEGNHEACFRIYHGAALELTNNLSQCAAVRTALRHGMSTAEKLDGHTARAWAMRDAFDGVLNAIEHKGAPRAFAPKREVPKHPVSIVEGCPADGIAEVVGAIESAIESGAPLYNQGNPKACFLIYSGTAYKVKHRNKDCGGLVKALEAGVERASTLEGDEAKAWAMRDAFDGVLDVVSRAGSTK